MEQLVRATLPLGQMPPVVAEFRQITVGGAIAGCALESASHRFGQFCDTCLEIELEDGSCLTPSDERFHHICGSFGLDGRIKEAKIQLIDAASSVAIERSTFSKIEDALERLASSDADFIEGVVLGPEEIAVMEGRLDPLPSRRSKGWWQPWFIQRLGSGRMALEEYLFRWDRGAFWMGAPLQGSWREIGRWLLGRPLQLKWPPPDPPFWFRLLFGGLTSARALYWQLHQMTMEQIEGSFTVEDCYIPIEKAAEFIHWSKKELSIYPIWLCPVKPTDRPQRYSPSKIETALAIDVGLYGPAGDPRQIDRKVIEVGGRKMLYGSINLSKEEFEAIYGAGGALYDKLQR